MPARYVVQLLDDLDYPENETKADRTVELALDDRKATLYLTEAHYELLAKELAPWFEAPEKSGRATGSANDYRRRQREFVDLFGIRCRKDPAYPAYVTSTGKNGYYPEWLNKAFEAWISAGSPPPEKYRKVA